MIKFTHICKDELTQISYYYNFSDGYIYYIDYSEGIAKNEAMAKKGGYYGGVAGIFLYPVVKKIGFGLSAAESIAISFFMGVIAAICFCYFTVQIPAKSFSQENCIRMPKEEIWHLFCRGRAFRRKYFWTEIFLFSFTLLISGMAGAMKNVLLFVCGVVLWWVWTALVCARRPICTWKFKRKMKRRNK